MKYLITLTTIFLTYNMYSLSPKNINYHSFNIETKYISNSGVPYKFTINPIFYFHINRKKDYLLFKVFIRKIIKNNNPSNYSNKLLLNIFKILDKVKYSLYNIRILIHKPSNNLTYKNYSYDDKIKRFMFKESDFAHKYLTCAIGIAIIKNSLPIKDTYLKLGLLRIRLNLMKK